MGFILNAIIAMSIAGFLVMVFDKRRVQTVNKNRVNAGQNKGYDMCSYFFAIILGAPGVFAGMILLFHNIKKYEYWLIVAAGFVIDWFVLGMDFGGGPMTKIFSWLMKLI